MIQPQRYLARSIGQSGGLPLLAAGCPGQLEEGKRVLARFLGMVNGMPLYGYSACDSPRSGRYLMRFVGLAADGMPVYAIDCCKSSSPCDLLADRFEGQELAEHWQSSDPPPEVQGGRLHRGSNPLSWVQWNGTLPEWANGLHLIARVYLPLASANPAFLTLILSSGPEQGDETIVDVGRLQEQHGNAPGCALLSVGFMRESNSQPSNSYLLPVDDGPVDLLICATTQDDPYGPDSWWEILAVISQDGRRQTVRHNVQMPQPALRIEWRAGTESPPELDAISLRAIHFEEDENAPRCLCPTTTLCHYVAAAAPLGWKLCCVDREYVVCWWKTIEGNPAPGPNGTLPMDGVRIRKEIEMPSAWRMVWGISLTDEPGTAKIFISPTYQPTQVRLEYAGESDEQQQYNALLRVVYDSGVEYRLPLRLQPGMHTLEVCFFGVLVAAVDGVGLTAQDPLPGLSPFDLAGSGDIEAISFSLDRIGDDCAQCVVQPSYPPYEPISGGCCASGHTPDHVTLEIEGFSGDCESTCMCERLNGTWVLQLVPEEYLPCNYLMMSCQDHRPPDHPHWICGSLVSKNCLSFNVRLTPVDPGQFAVDVVITYHRGYTLEQICFSGTASRNCTEEQTVTLQPDNPCGYSPGCCNYGQATVRVVIPEE